METSQNILTNAEITESYQGKNSSFRIYAEHGVLLANYLGFGELAETVAFVKVALEAVERHSVKYWVNDSRQATIMRPEIEAYIGQELVPKLVALGIKRAASVVPASIFGELSLKRLINETQQAMPYEHHYFDNLADALNWVTS